MLRAAVILSLAVAALAVAVHDNVPEQVIRFGSVGTTFADLVGVMTPVTPVFYKGIPAYDFARIVDGVPVAETDKHFFRCSIMHDFYVPHANSPKPVLLCRNDAFEKSVTADSTADRIAFLFSAENLVVPSGVSDIELHFGKNLWKSFIEAHATAFAVPVTDSGAVRMGIMRDGIDKPFDSMLVHDVPVVRTKRQFGGGFSGSGAQASSSSFGGGGGFGGFPGGGFGGGFSGSQAQAGASSFGGGGGGFFG